MFVQNRPTNQKEWKNRMTKCDELITYRKYLYRRNWKIYRETSRCHQKQMRTWTTHHPSPWKPEKRTDHTYTRGKIWLNRDVIRRIYVACCCLLCYIPPLETLYMCKYCNRYRDDALLQGVCREQHLSICELVWRCTYCLLVSQKSTAISVNLTVALFNRCHYYISKKQSCVFLSEEHH